MAVSELVILVRVLRTTGFGDVGSCFAEGGLNIILFENARADLHGSLFSRHRSPLPGASIPIVPLSQPSPFLLGLFKGNTRVEIPASFGRK